MLLTNTAALFGSTFDTSGAGLLSFGTLTSASFGGLQGSGNLTLNNTTPAPVALGVGGNNASTTFSGGLSGNGSLTKLGSGTLTLAAPDSYTGTTLVAGGGLLLANSAALLGSTFDSSGTGSLSFGTLTSVALGGLQGSGNLTLNNAVPLPVSLSVGSNNASTTFSGVLSGSGGLTKTGTGALSLLSSNSYTGTTLVAGGTLLLANTGAISGSTFDTSGAGTLSFGVLTSATFAGLQGSGSLALSNAAPAAVSLTVGGNNVNTILTGGLGGLGSLTKIGSGTLTLAAANSFSGGTIINAGVVQAGNNSALGAVSASLVVNGVGFDVHGYSVNVGLLSGTGTIDDLAGSGSLTVGNGNASSTFAGTIQDSIGTLNLVKTGSGTLTIPASNSFTGTTLVSGGTLLLANTAQSPAAPSIPAGPGRSVSARFPAPPSAACRDQAT